MKDAVALCPCQYVKYACVQTLRLQDYLNGQKYISVNMYTMYKQSCVRMRMCHPIHATFKHAQKRRICSQKVKGSMHHVLVISIITPMPYIHTYIHTYINKSIHTCIHTYIHTYRSTYIHTEVHTGVHAYRSKYTHTHTQT